MDVEEGPSGSADVVDPVKLKDQANVLFKDGDYTAALKLYTAAIDALGPETKCTSESLSLKASLLSNRASAYMMKKPANFSMASNDCSSSLRLDSDNRKTMLKKVCD